jgi:formiminotetrahydrofolate cyclodeaminase
VPDPVTRAFADLALRDFVTRLSSADPVPGGGSASAVAGSLAAGLVAMVAALSDRPRYAEHAALHEVAGTSGQRLAARLLELADEDATAYAAYAAALKLPKDADAEREARTRAIRTAARGAAEAPLACVEACRDVVSLADALAGRSNVNASSDLGVAVLLAEAAAHGAAENVRVNLPSIGDVPLAERYEQRVAALVERIAATARDVRTCVASGDSRPPLSQDEVEALRDLGSLDGDGSRT